MIGYVFWHRPRAGVDPAGYEAGLRAFHAALAVDPPQNFTGSHTLRLPPRPATGGGGWPSPEWLADGGYEDWYLIDDFADLAPLKAAARDARRVATHDVLAAGAATGAAGLYRLLAGGHGTASPGAGQVAWFAKPEGVAYGDLIAGIDLPPGAQVWQRELVLGPAPEFRVWAPVEASSSGRVAGPFRVPGAELLRTAVVSV